MYLARNPQRVLSRAELLAGCLPEGDPLERTVDSHISKLRRKLEDAGVAGMPFSLRRVGYRMVQPTCANQVTADRSCGRWSPWAPAWRWR